MSEAPVTVGRRHLLVLGAAATLTPACGGVVDPLGGPFGGTVSGNPPAGTGTNNGTGPDDGGVTTGGNGFDASSPQPQPHPGGNDAGGQPPPNGQDAAPPPAGNDAGPPPAPDSGPPPSTCSTSGNILTLTFSQYPQLKQSGGSVSLNANGYTDPICGQSGIIVFESGGKYVALSSSCTHRCCAVSMQGSGFYCPCHGATFDLTGQPTNKVAPSALPALAVCSDANGVYVTLA